MIGIVLGGPQPVLRRVLRGRLARHEAIELLGDAGTPERLHRLVASLRPPLVVLDARWARSGVDLPRRLLARPAPPRVLLCTDTLARPEVLAAVKQGVHGCLPHDAPPALWHRAILAIHAGETWLPRALMASALAELAQLARPSAPPAAGLDGLTERQRQIVQWVVHGLGNKEIGRRLGISPTTVKTHLHNIFERTGISGRQRLTHRSLTGS